MVILHRAFRGVIIPHGGIMLLPHGGDGVLRHAGIRLDDPIARLARLAQHRILLCEEGVPLGFERVQFFRRTSALPGGCAFRQFRIAIVLLNRHKEKTGGIGDLTLLLTQV